MSPPNPMDSFCKMVSDKSPLVIRTVEPLILPISKIGVTIFNENIMVEGNFLEVIYPFNCCIRKQQPHPHPRLYVIVVNSNNSRSSGANATCQRKHRIDDCRHTVRDMVLLTKGRKSRYFHPSPGAYCTPSIMLALHCSQSGGGYYFPHL